MVMNPRMNRSQKHLVVTRSNIELHSSLNMKATARAYNFYKLTRELKSQNNISINIKRSYDLVLEKYALHYIL